MSRRTHSVSRRLPRLVSTVALTGLVALLISAGASWASSHVTITPVDEAADVGLYSSLELNGTGNPVISYADSGNDDLRILVCDDPTCDGSGESLETPDTSVNIGPSTSLALTDAGTPVVAYQDRDLDELRILACDDEFCAGSESITSPDDSGNLARYPSLELNASGHPVVSYYDATARDLKILVCNDPLCDGTGESITTPDPAGTTDDVGAYASLELDSSGNPVVSYYDDTNDEVKILVCDDPLCDGTGESITVPGRALSETGGQETSLTLNVSDYPVVAYRDEKPGSIWSLKLLTCNDTLCAGGDDSITTPEEGGRTGVTPSVTVDGSGYPVVAYRENFGADLRILRCNDAQCAGGDDSIAVPDGADSVGLTPSLQLDASGNPVVSYWDGTGRNLKLLVCNVATCTVDTTGPIATIDLAAGQEDPTNTLPVQFSVAFDESVTGFTEEDVSVSGSASPSGVSVTGSGDTYIISVGTVASDGDVEITVADGAVQDGSGNDSTSIYVNRTVEVDRTAPVVSVPEDDVTATADEGATSTTVTFSASADEGDVSCAPASGSDFSLGTTSVTCSASDDAGNVGTASFDVVVTETAAPDEGGAEEPESPADTEAPVFDEGTTGDQTIEDVEDGDPVNFVEPTATDDSGTVDVVCDPASGSMLPAGDNDVTCTATDEAGNSTTVLFTVSVLSAELAAAGAPVSGLAALSLLLLAAGTVFLRRGAGRSSA